MRAAGVVIGVIVLLAVAIVALAPATLVDVYVERASLGKFRISDAAGTIWDGRGTLTDRRNTLRLPLAWRVDRSAIAHGVLAISLLPPGGSSVLQGDIAIRDGGILAHALSMEVPAQFLSAFSPAGSAVVLGGQLYIDVASFEWSGERGSGTVAASWRSARAVSALGNVDLGFVEAALRPEERHLGGQIGNRGGDVRIDGTLFLDGVHARVTGTVTPLPSTPAAVARVLALLGVPDERGAVRMAWSGNLR